MNLHNHLQVTTNLTELDNVLFWFQQLQQPNIPRKVWIQCQTVLAEGFTNAVKHAHKDLPSDTAIDIEVNITPQKMEIYIWDFGPTFDLEQKLNNQEPMFNPDASSGRGLQLINCMVDQVNYFRTDDDRNCLSMVKHYAAS